MAGIDAWLVQSGAYVYSKKGREFRKTAYHAKDSEITLGDRKVMAIAKIRPDFQYSFAHQLDETQQRQLNFWSKMLPREQIVFYRIGGVSHLYLYLGI